MSWQEMLAEAAKMPTHEVRRHALVSIHNKHRCQMCFTCACVETLKARERIAKNLDINPDPYGTDDGS